MKSLVYDTDKGGRVLLYYDKGALRVEVKLPNDDMTFWLPHEDILSLALDESARLRAAAEGGG